MATQDNPTEDAVLEDQDEVETSQEEDETNQDVQDESEEETEDSDESEDSEEDDDKSETDDDDEPEFKKRFTQFKGDSYEEYVPELEKAHANLLGEMTRLKQADKDKQGKLDAVMAAAARDPEFAKKLDELMGDDAQEVTVDPALLKARQDMEESMAKEYQEFVDEHPELETDPVLGKQVLEQVTELGHLARKQGKILSMGKALKKAWALVHEDDDTPEKVVTKAKEIATKPKAGGSPKKPVKKTDFTEEQLSVAKKWGLTPEQLAAAKKSS